MSLLSGVSKVSQHFSLERSVETFVYTGFDVVIFGGNDLNLRLTNVLPLSPCILFGILFEVVNMYATTSTNDFADLSFIGTTHAYFERTSIHVRRKL